MRLIKGLTTAAITASLLVVPSAALAKRGDRDHDRMPDKWEKRHHLNVHANDARKDADHDGLSNLSEFRHGTDPQNADTDNDGMNDGTEVRDDTNPTHDDATEVSGTIVSFDNGVLTIQPAGDGSAPVSGTVNDQTRIECGDNESDNAPATQPAATMSSDGGSDDGSGDNSGPSDSSGSGDTSGSGTSDDGANHESGDTTGTGTTTQSGGDGANHDAGDDAGEDANQPNCTSADLKPGASVHEAKLMNAVDGSTVFTKIELVPAA